MWIDDTKIIFLTCLYITWIFSAGALQHLVTKEWKVMILNFLQGKNIELIIECIKKSGEGKRRNEATNLLTHIDCRFEWIQGRRCLWENTKWPYATVKLCYAWNLKSAEHSFSSFTEIDFGRQPIRVWNSSNPSRIRQLLNVSSKSMQIFYHACAGFNWLYLYPEYPQLARLVMPKSLLSFESQAFLIHVSLKIETSKNWDNFRYYFILLFHHWQVCWGHTRHKTLRGEQWCISYYFTL